jgi:CRISPR/Cas system CMR-associated protein Cmr3 (group 5 of RAMP superfamily)
MLTEEKRLAKFVHYYKNDFNFYSLVQSALKKEKNYGSILNQIDREYTDQYIYTVEFFDFIDGLNNNISDKENIFTKAGRKLFTFKLIQLQVSG